MVRILLITLLSTISVFSDEFLDLKKEGSYSVLKRENESPFLTNEHIVAIGLGNIWKLRPSRKNEKDRTTVESFIKAIARHAYAERSPLTFNMFEGLWDSTQDTALKEHFGCIHGIILTSHLLKSSINYNDDDSRILSKLKNRFNEKERQKFLEWSYNNLEESEKQHKKLIFEKLRELLATKELLNEEHLQNVETDSNSSFSGEFLDLKKEGAYPVLARESESPFLTHEAIAAMGLGNVWKLRPSRKDLKDYVTIELFIKAIVRHAYAERNPLTFNMYESLWDSTQNAALKEHFGCIHGIILASHLLKDPIHYNDDDSRILSKLKNRFSEKARQKFLEWSYSNLEESEKQKKKFTYERIKELLAAKELSREQFLVFMNEDSRLHKMTNEQLKLFCNVLINASSFSKRNKNALKDEECKATIFKIIKDVSETEIIYILRSLEFLLIRCKNDTFRKDEILSKFSDISIADRTDIIMLTRILVTEEIDAYDIRSLIDMISTLPTVDRADTVIQTLRFNSKEIHSYDGKLLISRISNLQRVDRTDIITQTLRLVTEGMSLSNITSIINKISTLSAADRTDIVTQTRRLVTEEMSNSDIINLISYIKDISQTQRSEKVDAAINAVLTAQIAGIINNLADRMDIIRIVLNPPQPIPTHRYGLAYEIHQYEGTVTDVLTFIRSKIGVTPLAEKTEVDSAMETWIKSLPANQQHKAREALRIGLSIDATAPDRLRGIYTYVKNNHLEFMDAWLKGYIGESIQAYEESNDPTSCTKGIDERMITGLRGIQELNPLFAETEARELIIRFRTQCNFGDCEDKLNWMVTKLKENGVTAQTSTANATNIFKKFTSDFLGSYNMRNDPEFVEDFNELTETFRDYYEDMLKPKLPKLAPHQPFDNPNSINIANYKPGVLTKTPYGFSIMVPLNPRFKPKRTIW
jgi:hypothetical protein